MLQNISLHSFKLFQVNLSSGSFCVKIILNNKQKIHNPFLFIYFSRILTFESHDFISRKHQSSHVPLTQVYFYDEVAVTLLCGIHSNIYALLAFWSEPSA